MNLIQLNFFLKTIGQKILCGFILLLFRILKKKRRDILIKKLLAKGIETRPGFVSFNQMKIYKKFCKGSFPISEKISESSLSLPTTSVSDKDQDYIISQLSTEIEKLSKVKR